MNKKVGTIVLIVVILIVILVAVVVVNKYIKEKNSEKIVCKVNKDDKKKTSKKEKKDNKKNSSDKTDTKEVVVVPTLIDKLSPNSVWCPTFQLVWNDCMDNLVKGDINLQPEVNIALNLNKQTYKKEMLSNNYYYTKYGKKTKELKEEIEKGIKDKFNETSDILDDFDWSEESLDKGGTRYLFYSMLYRKFEYMVPFEELEKASFGNNNKDVKYFGLNNDSLESTRNQIEVLYYNSDNDFAIAIHTKNGDEVIFNKGPKGETFDEIYNNMSKEEEEYMGTASVSSTDKFKVPYMDIDVKKEYTELEGKSFQTNNPDFQTGIIAKAIQTVKFSIDEKGGCIKSEAAMDIMKNALMREREIRNYVVDDTFALFLRENGKKKPYFAAKISDMSHFQ